MSNSLRELFCLSIIFVCLLSACEESTIVGSNIFENEDLEVLFADDIELVTRTVKVDTFENYRNNLIINTECPNRSLPTYSTGITLTHYLGSLSDPIFGNSSASIYTEIFPGAAIPDFLGSTLDSMVLVLAYDTSGVYGDINQPFDVEVYRVLEDMQVDQPSFNDTEFLISDLPIATRTNVTYNEDTLRVFLPEGDSIQAPALRIAFDEFMLGDDNNLPKQIFENPAASENTVDFTQLLNGLYIRMSSESNLMLGIDLTSSSLLSRMELFYTEEDSTKNVYTYFIGSKRFNNAVNDPSGSAAAAATLSGDDELLYVSGHDGFDVTIDISDAARFSEFAINNAVLEFAVSEPVGADAFIYPPSNSLLLTEIDENNEIISCIDDMVLGANTGTVEVGAVFGGDIEEVTENGTVIRKYRMNISKHVQNFLEGKVSSRLLLSIDNRSQNVRRSVLFGPSHPTYPAKLKLTYTSL